MIIREQVAKDRASGKAFEKKYYYSDRACKYCGTNIRHTRSTTLTCTCITRIRTLKKSNEFPGLNEHELLKAFEERLIYQNIKRKESLIRKQNAVSNGSKTYVGSRCRICASRERYVANRACVQCNTKKVESLYIPTKQQCQYDPQYLFKTRQYKEVKEFIKKNPGITYLGLRAAYPFLSLYVAGKLLEQES